ncbi:polysaccharide lyase [Halosolutus amylolyticus]|uniref:Polysaccharide lyase n=1 Tax=Halosolutus amylolyticus TaxID=2932267 RepID=A0ABD5PNR2_9EURY|nr:hypothetical protein [Halosolutus amylolyticus]
MATTSVAGLSVAGCLEKVGESSPTGDGNGDVDEDEEPADDEDEEPADDEDEDGHIRTHVPFDDSGAFDAFTEIYEADSLSIVPAPGYEGESDSCEVSFSEGDHGAGSLHYLFRDEHDFEPKSMHATYWLYFDESFQPSFNGKLPGFAGTYDNAGSAGRRSNGTNGWSARGSFYIPDSDGNVPIGNYIYHADMNGSTGTHAYWDTALERGQWYRIDQYLQLNTPGEHDGILRGWIDREVAYESEEWNWRDTDDLRIEEWWGHFYHGGSEPAPQDMSLYIDDLHLVGDQPSHLDARSRQ